jgi:hypothetical protein
MIITIGLLVGAVMLTKSLKYTDSTTSAQCSSKHRRKQDINSKICGLFKDGVCWKGKYDPDTSVCTKNSNYFILFLFIAAFITFIAFIVYLVKGFKYKKTMNFAYHNNYDDYM